MKLILSLPAARSLHSLVKWAFWRSRMEPMESEPPRVSVFCACAPIATVQPTTSVSTATKRACHILTHIWTFSPRHHSRCKSVHRCWHAASRSRSWHRGNALRARGHASLARLPRTDHLVEAEPRLLRQAGPSVRASPAEQADRKRNRLT